MNARTRLAHAAAILAIAAGSAWTSASAQTSAQTTDRDWGARTNRTAGTVVPQRATLLALSRPITLDVRDTPLADIITFITEATGADIQPLYLSDRNDEGMDPEQLVDVRVRNLPALVVLERVLEKASVDFGLEPFDSYAWQMDDYGAMVVGPKPALNRDRRIEIYDVNDLLFFVPNFDGAPDFDLSSALQNVTTGGSGGGGGGGSGSSPFTGSGSSGNGEEIFESEEDREQELLDIIQANIESEQWIDNGGDAATIRFYNGNLIVNAPDYIHRQIDGYSYWPSRLTRFGTRSGRVGAYLLPDRSAWANQRP